MSGSRKRSFYDLEIYRRYEAIADRLWALASKWEFPFNKHPGFQMLRAVDSIGANIAEAIGRYHFRETLQFLYYARGSLTETVHWIRQATRRDLITAPENLDLTKDCQILHKKLNAFIAAQRNRSPKVSEPEKPTYENEPANRNWSTELKSLETRIAYESQNNPQLPFNQPSPKNDRPPIPNSKQPTANSQLSSAQMASANQEPTAKNKQLTANS